jgi:hypothetical protein
MGQQSEYSAVEVVRFTAPLSFDKEGAVNQYFGLIHISRIQPDFSGQP